MCELNPGKEIVTQRYLCIHGHFYQPPRENPWLEAVEIQDSAYPYHDWNERVTAECYAPNAASRVLDGEHHIVDIVNNYAKISFDFGPTLHSWIAQKAPKLNDAIVAADHASRDRFDGHGSAMAQAYNHMILPLANERDKTTQVLWGIHDFKHRFGRFPEGMWLPEAAVDVESLETLARLNIHFTVLSPYSAKRIRKSGDGEWIDVSGGQVDPSRAYVVRLPSGRRINVFFYDGPVSRAIAFEDLLSNGETFARRLNGAFSDARDWPQLAHIATDGETYGHHRRHGDMALAYALRTFESEKWAELTVYSHFLEMYPPTHEAEVFDQSSWSCAHGVGRWCRNCGCNSGGHTEWNQEWREPLRNALDWLRDTVAPLYEKTAGEFLADPWRARDDYIQVILNRSKENLDAFFHDHGKQQLCNEQKTKALELLELQRHTMLMYTSCGWFFDELSGIETTQCIQYAGRVVQLAEKLFQNGVEAEFLNRLSQAKSNIPEMGTGKDVFEKYVKPMTLDLLKVGAHYGVSSLFTSYGDETRVYSYLIHRQDQQALSSGKTKVAIGHAQVTSEITLERGDITFAFASLGDHHIAGGVREFVGEEAYRSTVKDIILKFDSGEFPDLIRALDSAFGSESYSLKLLFRDEQRKILDRILQSALSEADASYRQLYDNRAPLMRFLAAIGMPPIRHFQIAAEFTLNADLRHAIDEGRWNHDAIAAPLEEAQRIHVPLDVTTLEFALRRRLEAIANEWCADPCNLEKLKTLEAAVRLARSFPFEVQLWEVQNSYYFVYKSLGKDAVKEACKSQEQAQEWADTFRSLGELLSMRIE